MLCLLPAVLTSSESSCVLLPAIDSSNHDGNALLYSVWMIRFIFLKFSWCCFFLHVTFLNIFYLHWFIVFFCLSFCLFDWLTVSPSACQFLWLSFSLSLCLYVWLSVCRSVCLIVWLLDFLFLCLSEFVHVWVYVSTHARFFTNHVLSVSSAILIWFAQVQNLYVTSLHSLLKDVLKW